MAKVKGIPCPESVKSKLAELSDLIWFSILNASTCPDASRGGWTELEKRIDALTPMIRPLAQIDA